MTELKTRMGGVEIRLVPYLREDEVRIVDGVIYARTMSAVLAQVEREQRRAQAAAAFGADGDQP
jgi:hypothetical protein